MIINMQMSLIVALNGLKRNMLTIIRSKILSLLNIQRACEAIIDIACILLGIPQSSRDAFDLLQKMSLMNRYVP
ncbi:hypothetical protein HNR31_000626 [Anoxybacillus caldiproteolyticus]|uniref:Uncharacterized protein n=1 Tax=Thermaerobacillus caldiproteolyticus TaxID=247480 RepID=A0A7V9Z4I2_9BACL|nr:hypothetical protein [Anoxybacillus caldiproteolyticus]